MRSFLVEPRVIFIAGLPECYVDFFVVLMAYIVFDLIVKLADQTRKFELYDKALKSEIIGLNEKIENWHNDMDMLLQSHHESRALADMKEIKKIGCRKEENRNQNGVFCGRTRILSKCCATSRLCR